jgi:hypothetical protein
MVGSDHEKFKDLAAETKLPEVASGQLRGGLQQCRMRRRPSADSSSSASASRSPHDLIGALLVEAVLVIKRDHPAALSRRSARNQPFAALVGTRCEKSDPTHSREAPLNRGLLSRSAMAAASIPA